MGGHKSHYNGFTSTELIEIDRVKDLQILMDSKKEQTEKERKTHLKTFSRKSGQ